MTSLGQVKNLLKTKTHINVNLGAADAPMVGFINVDMQDLPGVDVVCDLEKFPWPFPSESVDLIIASQLVEHINPHGGVFISFMDEAHRILKPKGQFMIATPYAGSIGYWQDPTHCNGCNELTFCYFDPLDATTGGILYQNYHPKPWHILENSWYSNGNLECLLEKRPDDPVYHKSTAQAINVKAKLKWY
jgi:SAM-dependent methyltransferase